MVSQVFDPSHWNGHWKLVSRENYEELLRFNGVPEESFQGAKTADDFWTYEFSEDGRSFHMLHEIPATNVNVNFKTNIDGQWYSCYFDNRITVPIGGRVRSVLLEGPAPRVDIGQVARKDFCAGKVIRSVLK